MVIFNKSIRIPVGLQRYKWSSFIPIVVLSHIGIKERSLRLEGALCPKHRGRTVPEASRVLFTSDEEFFVRAMDK